MSDNKLSNFREKNWIEWLKNLNRYNLSPFIWYQITPEQWRRSVCEYLRNSDSQNSIREKNLDEELFVFVANPLSGQTKKRNKSLRNTFLTHSYFDSKRNSLIKKFSRSNKNFIKTNIIINRMNRFRFTYNRQTPKFFLNRKNIIFGYNLLLSLIPEFIEKRNMYQWEEVLDSETFFLNKANRDILQTEKLVRAGELNQFIRQWKWKSNYSEKRFRKLGDMASLMTFVQDQENTISLSEKMREDLNLFRLSFRTNISLNQVMIDSEHRLPRLLNDEILMYKVVSTSLSFKQRLKKASNAKSSTNYYDYWNNQMTSGREKKNPSLLNLEDILLPKRRREFRVLNCFFNSSGNLTEDLDVPKEKMGRSAEIKRFTWPSYRFEDLACMNRFSLSTINGSRFSMLRFRIYPLI